MYPVKFEIFFTECDLNESEAEGTLLPGYCQSKLNRRLHVDLGKLLSFSRGVIIGPSLTDSVRIGCLPPLPCRHCVKPANSAPWGEKPDW